MMHKKDLPFNVLMGIPIFSGSKSELLDQLTAYLQSSSSGILRIFTPNPEQFVLATEDKVFHQLLVESEINLPDGEGLVWALERKTQSKLQRIPGRELFKDLLLLAVKKKIKVFLLGGKPGSARDIALKYNREHALIRYDEGATDIQNETLEEKNRVLEKIKKHQPDLVFVAYGAPWQEKWISENRGFLDECGVKVAMVVGGAFEYEAGKVPPVSPLIEKLHLEWLQRLLIEPWRWRRQLKGLQFFFTQLRKTD